MKLFKLTMLTPEKTLFQGEVQSLKVMLEDGGLEVLASHLPSIAYLFPGECRVILENGEKKVFVSADGVLNIKKSEVILTSDFLEWEENISIALQEKQKRIALEKERRSASFVQNQLGTLDLFRTLLKSNKKNTL
ncbi:MAG: F0F1 ATP synthase subunit epsilon [Christensenellales bacterium]|jgi:F-type H+-transporting ATPase subunit epsilon|nr:F0F1 ATP synthase subunit epsilon [Clostridiales bacterium]